ncbi:MAG: GNAT family N-acetyltransferase [Lentimicrobiaceae bacterium]|nr:GNAT family N-acetyltransferase [Lentimicrobiaceae bacterium]
MFYKKAITTDIPKIKSLWKEVFGDSEDYIHSFITHFGIDGCYVCEINDEIIAMAFAIPTTLSYIDNNSPSNFEGVSSEARRGSLHLKYLYACATHPNFRKQGIMEKLLTTIYAETCSENYAGIFLHAANHSLQNYYKKLGFEDYFFRNHSFYCKHNEHKDGTKDTKSETLDFNNLSSLQNHLLLKKIKTITPDNYYQKRIKKLENFSFINWNTDFFIFLNETGTHFFEYENSIFSFRTNDNLIIIDEWLAEDTQNQIANLLFEQYPDFETIQVSSMENKTCCGQIKWCRSFEHKSKNGYFAFAME